MAKNSSTPTPPPAPTFAQIFDPERPAVLSRLGSAGEGAEPAKRLVNPVAAKLAPRAMPVLGALPTAASRPPMAEPVTTAAPVKTALSVVDAGATCAPVMEPVGSEALLVTSRRPAMLQALAVTLRWGAIGMLALGACYALGRYVVFPVLKEMKAPPPGASATIDPNATTAAKVIQQTRQTVAKNDAKVEYLHTIIDEPKPAGVGPAPASANRAPVTALEVAAAPPKARALRQREAVERYVITAAYQGDDVRILLDGRLVKFGEIVDRELGLRFMGLEPGGEPVALFTNADNTTFRKRVESR